MRRRHAGFSFVELIVALALFAVLLLALVSLERQMFRFDRESRIALFRHPEPLVLIERFRRDVLDAASYPAAHAGFAQSPEVLVLGESGGRVVVYDFSKDGVATRIEFGPGDSRDEWSASAMPAMRVGSEEMPDGSVAVKLTGRHGEALLYESIVAPRRMMP